jgi:endoglucanase
MSYLHTSLTRLRRALLACSPGSAIERHPPRIALVNTPKVCRAIIFSGALLSTLFSLAASASAQTPMQTYVEAMQPGTNWGNTLDAIPNRHSWGAPETTQAMIQGLVDKGYKSLRIPITWSNYMGSAPDYAIDPAWMDHVQQVVDWSLDAGLYVMINLHHDSWTWLDDMPADHDAVLDRYRKVWMQIATRFKDHSNKLLFESINEPGFEGLDDAAQAALLHEVNTAFYTLVRGTGGGNTTRPLVLPSVYTRADQPMIDSLKNTITSLNDPNLIATVHYYGWYPFSVNLGGYTTFDETSLYWVHTPFDAVHNTFVADGIPVIVGEFSVLSGSWIQRGEQLKYHEYVQAYGRSKGMTMMLWDTGGIYGRGIQDWANPDLGNILMQAVVGRAITAESDMLFVKAGAPVEDRIVNLQLNGNTLVSIRDNGTPLTPLTDYTLSGDTLTLKAHVLAKYATGAFGEKATLTLHANAGPAWKIFVRYFDKPLPGPLTTTTGVAIHIPVAFNGDLLATMESKYANGTNAGPTNWTSFQPFGEAFRPNYANNTIVLDDNFLRDAPPGIVNLDFHFWSGLILKYRLEIKERSSESGTEYVIYDDNLASGWHDWSSWTPHNLASTSEVHSGSQSISITPGAYGGVGLQNGGPAIDTSAYRTLTFWIHGGTTGGQSVGVIPIRAGLWGEDGGGVSIQAPTPVANTWQKVEIPLSSFLMEGRPDITGFAFQHWSGTEAPTFYIDDIHLTTAQSTAVMDIYGTPVETVTFAEWASVRGLTAANNAATADPDGDGVANQLEFKLGFNPLVPDSAGLPTGTIEAGRFVFRFTQDTTAIGVTLTVQQSTDLLSWTSVATAVESTTPTTETLIASLPMTGPRLFMRLVSNDDLPTVPVGYLNTDVGAGATTAFSVPLDDTANPTGIRAGKIESFTAATITHAAGGWTGNLANASSPWAVRLTSGSAAGKLFDIVANDETTLTLGNAALTTLGVVAGDTFELVPLDTLGTLFPPGALLGGTSPASADVVQVRSGTSWVAFYYNTSLGFWRRTSGAPTNSDNVVVRPGSGLMLTRRGGALTLNFTGRVLGATFRTPVANASTTATGLGYPMDTTLGAFGLQNLLAGWRAGTTMRSADSVGIHNGTTWVPYVFNGTGWQTTSGVNSDNLSLPAGTVLLVSRPGNASGTTDLVRTKPY